MNILVTGGAGFIGSALIRFLISDTSHTVINVDKLTYAANLASLESVAQSSRYHFEQVDICDRSKLDSVFSQYLPDAVMHLAAESHVDRSITGPSAFIQTNIVGTYTLLEAARAYWGQLSETAKLAFRFHHISTDEVFGDLPHPDDLDGGSLLVNSDSLVVDEKALQVNRDSLVVDGDSKTSNNSQLTNNKLLITNNSSPLANNDPQLTLNSSQITPNRLQITNNQSPITANNLFTETTPYAPNSPYAASKASSDHLVRAWHRTYGLPIIISNCANNYGPYQYPEKLIPLIITRALAGESLPVYGDGAQIRDWLYVDDHVRALYKVVIEGQVGESYNIGGHNERRNIDVVKAICSILDELRPMHERGFPPSTQHSSLIIEVADRPGHDRRYAIDASKMSRELNWQPQETFETGLRKTVEWYLVSGAVLMVNG